MDETERRCSIAELQAKVRRLEVENESKSKLLEQAGKLLRLASENEGRETMCRIQSERG